MTLTTSVNRSLVLLLSAAASWLLPNLAAACSCMPSPPPDKAFDVADAVLLATVSEIRRPPAYPEWAYHLLDDVDRRFDTGFLFKAYARATTVDFVVDATWKGVSTARTAINTAGNEGLCGYRFVKGEQYLIYAYRHDDVFATSICSRTAAALDAGEDLDFLADLDQLPRAEVPPEPRLFWVVSLLIVVATAALSLRLLGRRPQSPDDPTNSAMPIDGVVGRKPNLR